MMSAEIGSAVIVPPGPAQEYYDLMPWVAVPYENDALRRELARHFGVSGIPTLAIVDPSGKIINGNARAAVMRDPEGADFPWPHVAAGSYGSRYSCFCC